jgi:uncharacterized protein with PIN domain
MAEQGMISATFRFYAELNDHLAAPVRMRDIRHDFQPGATVKDRIESLGVPHTEVDLILVNGQPADFSYLVQDGDRVSVYPMFEALDISAVARLRPAPLRATRFILDTHLGRLAQYLRLLGFDSRYDNQARDDELARIERDEKRILLTRDRGLLKRSSVSRGYFIRETEPRSQLISVLRRFDLFGVVRPFVRCLRCNTPLEKVEKEAIASRLPEKTSTYYSEFQSCAGCGRIYWPGSHYEHMRRFVEWVVQQNAETGSAEDT